MLLQNIYVYIYPESYLFPRHESYQNQYRAMFVMNCTIDRSEKLAYPVPGQKTSKKKKKKLKIQPTTTSNDSNKPNSSEDSVSMQCTNLSDSVTEPMASNATNVTGPIDNNEPMFNPVRCQECNTVVAVYDDDEVYHFFNVLSSY